MRLDKIKEKLEAIEQGAELKLDADTFSQVSIVLPLLQKAFGEEKLLLYNVETEPENGLLCGWVKEICVEGASLSEVQVKLRFSEIFECLVLETVVLTDMVVPEQTAMIKRFCFQVQGYRYAVNERMASISRTTQGQIGFGNQQLPAEIVFSPDVPFLELSAGSAEEEEEGASLPLEVIFDFMGVEELKNLLPIELKNMLEMVLLEKLSLCFDKRRGEIHRLSMTVLPLERLEWGPAAFLNMTLSSLSFGVGDGFYITVAGECEINGVCLLVSCSFHSKNKAVSIRIADEEEIKLGSLSALAKITGNIDTSILPFAASDFYLQELTFGYSFEKSKTEDFSLAVSVRDVWSLMDMVSIDKLCFGIYTHKDRKKYILGGAFHVSSLSFYMEAAYMEDAWEIYGYMPENQRIMLAELAGALKGTPVELPEFWISRLAFYSNTAREMYELSGRAGVGRPEETERCFGQDVGSCIQKEKERLSLGIGIGGSFCFGEIPFIGALSELLKEVALKGLAVVYSDHEIENISMKDIIEGVAVPEGLSIAVQLELPGKTIPLQTSFSKKQKLPEMSGQELLAEAEGAVFDGLISVEKNIGPVSLHKLGLTYEDGTVEIGVIASLSMGALKVTLEQLRLGYQVKEKKVEASLGGLEVAYLSKSFQLAGGFYQGDKEKEAYTGNLLVKAGALGLSLYGGFEAKPYASGFLFGMLSGNICGSPGFYITGLAAGFGYSRRLEVPDIKEIEDFSLLGIVMGKREPESVIANADTVFPPEAGSGWFAAGLKAKAFEMADIGAVVAVRLDKSVHIDLLGSADLTIPKGVSEPVARAGFYLKVSIDPDSGCIPVEGILAENSYVLSPNCHLSGGFAFYLWYGGSHAGDFVITLGGYSGSYRKPAHYPSPDRLMLSWKLSDELYAEGSLYFALTPSGVMAGGDFSMVFDWECVHAWFHAYVDILMQWKPYAYAFRVGISIGVSVNLKLFKIKLELGCDLELWGPDFSGIAHVHLWIISFTIRFGHGAKPGDDKIGTDEFRTSFLPQNEQNDQKKGIEGEEKEFTGITISLMKGLLCERQGEKQVSPEALEILVKSPAPASKIIQVTGKGEEKPLFTEKEISLKPCGTTVSSELRVEFSRADKSKLAIEPVWEAVYENVPSALWGGEEKEELVRRMTGISMKIEPYDAYRSLTVEMDFFEELCEIKNNRAEPEIKKLIIEESCVPALQSGKYRMAVWQKAGELGNSRKEEIEFEVNGPRFALDREDILFVYPGNGMTGSFDTSLAHVAMSRKTLPWERSVEKQVKGRCMAAMDAAPTKELPWMCLLVLHEKEIEEISTGIVEQVTSPGEKVFFPELFIEEKEKGENCRYIDIPSDLYTAVMPKPSELSLLCHGRREADKEQASSVLIANRLPASSQAGTKNRAYLVSLEGFGRDLSIDRVSAWEKVRLIVLYSWDFYSIESPRHFLEVCRELSKERLKKGYMPLEHQLRNGESCMSFYRGPFVPAASEAGTADVSRAAARELGRLLAMKNQPAASELLRLRQHNKRALHKKEQKQMLQRNGVASGRRGGSWLLKILEEKGDELL